MGPPSSRYLVRSGRGSPGNPCRTRTRPSPPARTALVRGPEQVVAALAVPEAEDVRPVLRPPGSSPRTARAAAAPGTDPGRRWRPSPAPHARSPEAPIRAQPGVDPGRHAADVTGTDEQLVARHFRVHRVLAQGPEEQRRHPGQHRTEGSDVPRRASPVACRRAILLVAPDSVRRGDGPTEEVSHWPSAWSPPTARTRRAWRRSGQRRCPPPFRDYGAFVVLAPPPAGGPVLAFQLVPEGRTGRIRPHWTSWRPRASGTPRWRG